MNNSSNEQRNKKQQRKVYEREKKVEIEMFIHGNIGVAHKGIMQIFTNCTSNTDINT